MSEYVFERLNSKNLNDLLFLYKHAFNEIETLEFLKKKYDTTFAGVDHVGFLAYHTETKEPAAYYGVFPSKLTYQGKDLIAAQSGDTMTHPNHRGKGLFITLAKLTYDLARSLGIEFIYGFPNDNSYPGFIKKLDWKHYSNVNHYKIKASSIPFDKLAKKFKWFKPIHQLLLPKEELETGKQFSNSITAQSKDSGGVKHDSDFYRYKCYYPSFIIEIEGVKCWVKVDGRLWVGDIEFCDEAKFNAVVNGLINYAKKKFCASVQFSFFEKSSYDQNISKRFAKHSSIAVGCLNLNGHFDPDKFAYQAGDFDTF
jgi:hypothetical protein